LEVPELGLIATGVALTLLVVAVAARPEAVVMALGVYLFLQSAIVRVDDIPSDVQGLLARLDEVTLALLVVRTLVVGLSTRNLRIPPPLLALAGFAGVGVISWFVNGTALEMGGVGLFLAAKSGLWLLVALGLRYQPVVVTRYGLLIGALFAASIALAVGQFLGMTLPWDAHVRRSGELAATSIWNQHTVFGSAMAVAFALGIVALRLPGWRTHGLTLAGLAAIGVILSTVRRLFLSMPIGAVTVLATIPASERVAIRTFVRRALRPQVLVVVALLFVVAIPTLGPRLVRIGADTWDEYIVNAHERDRYVLYQGGFELMLESPIVGRGPGTYGSYASVLYDSPVYEELGIALPDSLKMGAPIASLAGEFGVAGFAAFAMFIVLVLRGLAPIARRTDAPLAAALASGGLFMVVNMVVESVVHVTFADSFVAFFAFLAVGAATQLSTSDERLRLQAPTPPRLAAVAGNLGLAAALLASMVGVVAWLSPSFGFAEDLRPNIVLIVTDDLTIETLQLLDGRRNDGSTAPTIPELIGDVGVTIEGATASDPSDCPARVSILTGLAASQHGVSDDSRCYEAFLEAGLEDMTVASWLQDAGYRTAFVGHYLAGYGRDDFDIRLQDPPPGWTEWRSIWGTPSYWSYRLNENGRISGRGASDEFYLTDLQTRAAVRMITEGDRRALFLAVMPFAPHEPPEWYPGSGLPASDSPEPGPGNEHLYDDAEHPSGIAHETADLQGRLEAMASVEAMVAAIVQALSDAGELENTYIIFTSDNGMRGVAAGDERGVHIPLMIAGPGIPAGIADEDPVSSTDIVPTLLDIAATVAPVELPGTSLLDQLGAARQPESSGSASPER